MINHDDFTEDRLTLSTNEPVIEMDNIDSGMYFKGGHWGQCLELLQHLCQYSENIILVVGEEGVGKTTLKQAMLENANAMFKYCDLNADMYSDIEELSNDIAIGFGVSSRNNLNLITNIAALSERDDKIRVLLIDNAHLFSIEVLTSLLRLLNSASKDKIKTDAKFRLVLLGRAGLEEKLDAVKAQIGKDDNTHVLELEPLSLSEVELYLLYKWRSVGNIQAFPFDNVLIKKIHQISAGNPREIEKLVREYLASGRFSVKENKNKFKLPAISYSRLFIISIIFIGVVGIAMFFGKTFISNSTDSQVVKIEMSVTSDRNFKGQEHVQYKSNDAQASSANLVVEKEIQNPNIPEILPKKEEVLAPVVPEQTLSKILDNDNKQNPQAQQPQEQTNIAILDKGTTLSDKVDSIKPGEDVKQIQPESNQNILITADTKPETVEQPTLIPPNNGLVTTQPIEQKTVEVESEQPKVVVVDKNIKKIKEVKPKPTITKTNNYSNKYVQKILKFPNNHYTLQLLGASDIKGIERFIINNKLQNQAYYYCTTHNKKPWYILIYGNYSTKEQAKNAITRLPTTVQALHPWARDFSSVKKTLQTRN